LGNRINRVRGLALSLVKGNRYAVVRPRIEAEGLIAMDRPASWL
jgi:hypothetical protein